MTLSLAAGIALLPGTSQAYTADQQQACTPDAFRLCNSDIPDVDRVTACMIRNKALLSPQCRAFFGPEPREVVERPARRPVAERHRVVKPRKPKKSAKPAAH
ncbi:hypothetical protein [Bradyrhizobium genosp. L]|uniref:hypothetical protein n=1 Tax=Bradyrhizobium genosp. L TaxID=83637 RepID=UPI001FEF9147|nr:hypothetical protein [Bradyrhizobium genosp. L]